MGVAEEKLNKLGDISIQRDWGWSLEFVDAMWRMFQGEVQDDFLLLPPENRTHLSNSVATAFSEVGLDWRQHVVQDQSLYGRTTEIRYSCGQAEKARKKLNWEAHMRMKDVVREMIRYERQL